MSKITMILIFTLSLLFSQENEKFSFVGIGTSVQTIDFDTFSETEPTVSLRYGQQTVDWRTSFTYEFKNGDYQNLSVEIDKILVDELFDTPKLRPYLGFSAGLLKYKEEPSLNDTDGFYYGGNVGFIIYLTDTMDLDLSYHHNVVHDIETLDTIKGLTLFLHYFY